MIFHSYGPFDVPEGFKRGEARVDKFWEDVEKEANRWGWENVDRAIGCYLFALRARSGFKPVYVGQTNSQAGFRGEISQPHKLAHYAEALSGNRRGAMFLFPLMTTSGNRFAKPSVRHSRVISWLEDTMMRMAWARNPEIANTRNMKFLREVRVEGVLGKWDGRPSSHAVSARKALKG